jgi:hypothetical protein
MILRGRERAHVGIKRPFEALYGWSGLLELTGRFARSSLNRLDWRRALLTATVIGACVGVLLAFGILGRARPVLVLRISHPCTLQARQADIR